LTTYATDTFTDADATPLASHTPDAGGAWADDVAGLEIQSNQADGPSFAGAFSRNTTVLPSADYAITATLDFQSFSGISTKGIIGRWSGGNFGDGYYARWNAGIPAWELFKEVGAVYTQLGTAAEAIVVPQTRVLTLDMAGTTIRLLVDSIELVNVTDSDITATGETGIWCDSGASATIAVDDFSINSAPPVSGTHVVIGRGSFAVTSPLWLSTTIAGRPGVLSNGAAEPPNWYHVGMLSWGTANGAMSAYPVTRDLDLVQLPSGMDTVWYEFVSGVTATIVEQATP
jgi:hypothetical protein